MRRSEPGLDLFRALAVLLMFEAHVYTLAPGIADRSGSFGERALWLMSYVEPFTAAAFLFIVGFSLVLSHRRFGAGRRGAWVRLLLRRAGLLYGLSAGLFVAHYGFELPDLIASSGILSVIALTIAAVGGLLAARRPEPLLAAFAVVVIAVTAWLDSSGATVSGLNAGPGGAFPLLALTAAGALAGRLYCRDGIRALGWPTAATVVLSAVAAWMGPWTTERASHYAAHGGEVALADLLSHPTTKVAVVFWNHSAVGAIGLLGPLMVGTLVLLATQKVVCRPRAMAPMLWLGRHALAVYVMHLVALGLADLAGLIPQSAAQTWGMLLALSLLAMAFAAGLEGWRVFGRKRAAAAVPAAE